MCKCVAFIAVVLLTIDLASCSELTKRNLVDAKKEFRKIHSEVQKLWLGTRYKVRRGVRRLAASRKLTSPTVCSWSGLGCQTSATWLMSEAKNLPANSAYGEIFTKSSACAEKTTENACTSVTGCEWEGHTCEMKATTNLGPAILEKLTGEGDECGFFGAIMKNSTNDCSTKSSESSCVEDAKCKWMQGGLSPPDGAVVGDACEESSFCAAAEEGSNIPLCGSKAMDAVFATCMQEAMTLMPDYEAFMNNNTACISKECPLYAALMEGNTACNGQVGMDCMAPECSLQNGSCHADPMHWMMKDVSDSCPLKSYLSTQARCSAISASAACAADADCSWQTTHDCDDNGKTTRVSACGVKASVLFKALTEVSCDDDSVFMYKMFGTTEICEDAQAEDTCTAVTKPATPACCAAVPKPAPLACKVSSGGNKTGGANDGSSLQKRMSMLQSGEKRLDHRENRKHHRESARSFLAASMLHISDYMFGSKFGKQPNAEEDL